MLNVFILGLFETSPNWFLSALRSLFIFIDTIVYGVISIFFRTIFNLANFELVGLYEVFEKRVYVILGIFMLFKVTISLITYLVNPDKISDKEQGMGKVVTRIITVLVMLIALPTFFNLTMELQNKLLPVIPRVIMGTTNTLSTEDVSGIASNMSLTLLQGFAHRKEECSGTIENVSGETTEGELSKLSDLLAHVNDTCEYNGRRIYAYDYLPIVSTIVGILMIYVLFSLCITVAIRAFKLIILRMIAPVPIISYVDPKSSKDGMLSTYRKTFLTTWGELFLLIAIFNFDINMLDFLLSRSFWIGFFNGITNPIDGILLLAFLIIGLLFFTKQAPKYCFDALGIKTKGNFVRMLGMGAAALGMGGTVASSIKNRNEYDRAHGGLSGGKAIKNVGASLFSGLASGATAGSAILSTDKPTLGTGYDAQSKYNATNLNRIDSGSTLTGRLLSKGSGMLFGQTTADNMRQKNESLEKAEKAFKDYKSTIESRFDGNDDYTYTFTDKAGRSWTGNYNVLSRMVSAAQSGDSSAQAWLTSNGVTTEWFNQNQDAIHKAGYKTFTKDVVNKRFADSVVLGSLEQLKSEVKGIQVNDYDEFGDLVTDASGNPVTVDLSSIDFSDYGAGVKATMGDISGTRRTLVTNDKYKAAIADEKANKNK